MKMPEDAKKDIKKCSKCGLCQSVCPIYKLTGNECAVSKGKFTMLEGIISNDLNFSKIINKYLNMCSNCGKCKDFCPSGINPPKIFSEIKYSYSSKKLLSKIVFLLQSELIFNNLLKLFKNINNLFSDNSNDNHSGKLKLLYFKGCANNINPQNDIFLKKLLIRNTDITLIEKDFDCCGVPFLSSGNIERYNRAKTRNLDIIKKTPYDFIITDCASCESALKAYGSDLKIINIAEFLKGFKFKFNKPLKVTFHKPCHLKNYDTVKDLLSSAENIDYIEMENFDECCGFCGEFALKNPKIAYNLMKNKANSAIKSGADYVLTLCPACVIGLKLGAIFCGKRLKVMNLTEFFAQKKSPQ